MVTPTHNVESQIKEFAKNWGWYLLLGGSLVAAGALAVTFSVRSTLFSVTYLGFMLLFSGVMESLQAFRMRAWSGFFVHLLVGIMYAVLGGFMIYDPLTNATTLTLLIASFFIVSGLFRIVFALSERFDHSIWILISGALTVIVGILIFKQWPLSGLWVIGTFVGIELMLSGWNWVFFAFRLRRIAK